MCVKAINRNVAINSLKQKIFFDFSQKNLHVGLGSLSGAGKAGIVRVLPVVGLLKVGVAITGIA
jgi:ABC-type arginine transport system ATPase subunit